MASALVDTAYPDSDEAMRLCRVLDEPMADALPVRLWCWGIDTNRENGRFEADAKQLAQIVRFHGDPQRLLEAFLSCGVIETTPQTNVFRICGWKRNAKFFKERERLRKYKGTRNPRVQNASGTREARVTHEDPSSSSSSVFLSKEIRGDPPLVLAEKASVEFDSRGDEPKAVKPRSTRGFPEAAFECEFRDKATVAAVAKFDNLERAIGGTLVLRCGTEKITQAQLLAEWWRPEWRICGWTVKQLDKHFASVRAAIADPKMRPRPKRDAANDPPPGYRPMPNDEENARMLAERSKPVDPKQFAEVSAMMREHVEKMR